jgi:glycerophosphoryl diester phosphodiesterase
MEKTAPPRRRFRWLKRLGLGLLAFAAGVYLYNGSWWVDPPGGGVTLIAHRGVHQTYSHEDLSRDDCTATRMAPPSHAYLENTIDSMRAAFAAGADIVELDVHPTTDGQFAVFHDWTLDCRTDGHGPVREHDMATLRGLDIGYGYTPDGGQTFTFRGKGVGLMPELNEVLAAFPDGRFLINFKSKWVREGDMLAAVLAAHPQWRDAVWGAYGGEAPTARAIELIPGLQSTWPARAKDCLISYAAIGWTGYIAPSCHDTMVMVPVNVAPYLWGWPNLFQKRMTEAGSVVILRGAFGGREDGTAGIDDAETLSRVPGDFAGFVWTNKIEVIGPLVTGH